MSAARKRPLGWMTVAAILCAGSAAADVTPADRTAARALFDIPGRQPQQRAVAVAHGQHEQFLMTFTTVRLPPVLEPIKAAKRNAPS